MTKLSDSYGVLQAAGRGGQGASKNMIGTRGEDKVIILKLFSLPVKISMLTISCHLTKLEFSESFKKYFVARFSLYLLALWYISSRVKFLLLLKSII